MRVPPALIIGDELIVVPATREEQMILDDAFARVSDQIAEYAAAHGVDVYEFKTLDYERVVTRTPLMPPNRPSR